MNVCSPKEYEALKTAFFEKEKNLGRGLEDNPNE